MRTGVVVELDGVGPSRQRDCHSADALSPSLLKHLLKEEGGAAEWQSGRQWLAGPGGRAVREGEVGGHKRPFEGRRRRPRVIQSSAVLLTPPLHHA